jgi:hypothetical protein
MLPVSSKPDIETIRNRFRGLKEQLTMIYQEIGKCETRIISMEQEIELVSYDNNEKAWKYSMSDPYDRVQCEMYVAVLESGDETIKTLKQSLPLENQKKNILINKAKEIEDEMKALIHLKNSPVGGMDIEAV